MPTGVYTRRVRPLAVRFWPKVNKTKSCWLWTGAADRYGQLHTGGRSTPAHRVAWQLAGGTIPDEMHILHTCDVPLCVRNDDLGTYEVDGVLYERRGHLWLGDHVANMTDMANKGRAISGRPDGPGGLPGVLNPRAKLTEADVLEIRRRAAIPGTRKLHLARLFGVSNVQIGNVVSRKSWGHV